MPTGSPASAAAASGGGGEHDRDAGAGGDPGRLDLGDHAAGADAGPAGRADRDAGQVRLAAHLVDPARRRVGRVAGVERVHVGEQDQQVGVDQRGHQGGEPVVVAEADLLGGDRVVLVDDRHGAAGRAACAGCGTRCGSAPAGSRRRRSAAPGRRVRPCRAKRLGVGPHQQALPDAGGGLLGGQVARPAAQPERGQPGGDRAGGDQHHLAAAGGERRRARRPARRPGLVEPAGGGGQRRRADLDHDPAGTGHRFAHPPILLRPGRVGPGARDPISWRARDTRRSTSRRCSALVERIPRGPGHVLRRDRRRARRAVRAATRPGRSARSWPGTAARCPWHRVVTSAGRMPPGHEQEARQRLLAEGVPLKGDHVDMTRAGAGPPDRRQSGRTGSNPTPPRRGSPAAPARADRADAAEVVVEVRPLVDRATRPRPARRALLGRYAGLGVHGVVDGVEPRPGDRRRHVQPVDQHAEQRVDQRGPDPGRRRPNRPRRPAARPSSITTSGHMFDDIRRPGARSSVISSPSPSIELRLHAEPGQPDAGAEPERRGDHAGVAVGVDDRDVRGVADLLPARGRAARGQRDRAFARRQRGQLGRAAPRSCPPCGSGRAAPGRGTRPARAWSTGVSSTRYDGQVGGAERAAGRPGPRRPAIGGERAGVEDRRTLARPGRPARSPGPGWNSRSPPASSRPSGA